MDLLTYQTMAARSLNPNHDHLRALDDYGIGALTEAGEALDLVKKDLFDLGPIPAGKLIEELEDALWYQGALYTTLETTLHLAYHSTSTFCATIGTLSLEEAVRMWFQELSTAAPARRSRTGPRSHRAPGPDLGAGDRRENSEGSKRSGCIRVPWGGKGVCQLD